MKHTMKKTLAFLLTLVMLVNVFPLSALAGTKQGTYGPFGLSKAAGDNYHTVVVNVASDVEWNGHLYFVLKQEQANTPQGPCDQYYVGEIPQSGGTIQASTFKAAYYGATDNPYDNTKSVTVQIAVEKFGGTLESSTPINSSGNVQYITDVNGNTISITTDNTQTTTITIGDNSHSVIISGMTGTIDNGYYVQAVVDGKTYRAPIGNNGSIGRFSCDTDPNYNELTIPGMAETDTVKVVYWNGSTYQQTNTITTNSGNKIYIVSGPSDADNTYTFTATLLNQACYASFANTTGSALGNYYYVIATKYNGDKVFKQLQTNDDLIQFENTASSNIDNFTSFRIVKTTQEVSSISGFADSVIDASVDRPGQAIDDIVFTWDTTPSTEGCYGITANPKQDNVSVTITGDSGFSDFLTDDTDNKYYVVAGWNRNADPQYYEYSEVTTATIPGPYTFYVDDPLNDSEKLFVIIKQYPAASSPDPRQSDGTLVCGNVDTLISNPHDLILGQNVYTFTLSDPQDKNGVKTYTINVEKKNRPTYTADIAFLDASGTSVSSVTLEEGYTIEAITANGESYTATVSGTAGSLSFTPDNMYEISSFTLKKNGTDQNMVLGVYNLSYTKDEDNHIYHFTAAPAGEIRVIIKFQAKDGTPVVPEGSFNNMKVFASIGKTGTEDHWIAGKEVTFNSPHTEYTVVFDDTTEFK